MQMCKQARGGVRMYVHAWLPHSKPLLSPPSCNDCMSLTTCTTMKVVSGVGSKSCTMQREA